MAKPSSYKILNTNSWEKARKFVTQPVGVERRRGQKMIYNTETGKAYGMRSDSYELLRHEDALVELRKALVSDFSGSVLASVQLDNAGARMHCHVDLEPTLDLCPRVVFTNSYDGTLSIGIDTAASYKGMVMLFNTAERWIHFGNTADEKSLKEAIQKSLKGLERWVNRLHGLGDTPLRNPRLTVEWFQDQKIIPQVVAEAVINLRPYTAENLFYSMCRVITEYECTPTRKRDMYFDVVRALFSSQKWVSPVDKRRLAPDTIKDSE